MSSQLFTSNGTWVCPVGTNFVGINASGGGNGGNAGTFTSATTGGAGGAGGTVIASQNVATIPGTTYAIIVGEGGLGATTAGGIGGVGGNTMFYGDSLLLITAFGGGGAVGGFGGVGSNNGMQGGNSIYFDGGLGGTTDNLSPAGGGGGGAGGSGLGANGGSGTGSRNGINAAANTGAGGGGGAGGVLFFGNWGMGGNGGSGYLEIVDSGGGSSTPTENIDVQLVGVVDGMNERFTIPSGAFIYSPPTQPIVVYLNGVKQHLGGSETLDGDYTLAVTTNGDGITTFDTIVMNNAPQPLPSPPDIITADYFIAT